MGKALVIKDVDYSAVRAERVSLEGDIILTRDNAEVTVSARFYNRTITTDSNAKLLFYPIRQGQYLVCPAEVAENVGVSLGAEIGMSNFYGDGGCVLRGAGFPGTIVIQAPADGYAVLQWKNSSGVDIFPEGCVITETKPGTRAADLTTYCYGANKYINSSGRWGNDTAPAQHYACLFYNVHAGEKVVVTADGGNQNIAFLQMCQGLETNTPVFTQGGGKITITSGTTQTIVVEKEAIMYAYAAGGSSLRTIEIQEAE